MPPPRIHRPRYYGVLAPPVFGAGSLGRGKPERDLIAAEHTIGWIADQRLDESIELVAAMRGHESIRIDQKERLSR